MKYIYLFFNKGQEAIKYNQADEKIIKWSKIKI